MTEASARNRDPRPWAIVVIIGIAVYVVIDVVLAILRPDYSLIRNPESDYGRGASAWLMDVNFVLRGAFAVLATVALLRAGIARRWMAVFVMIWAITSALLAFFPDNPVEYPMLASGGKHLALAAVAFLAITVATLAISFSRSDATRAVTLTMRILSIVGAVAFLALAHPFGAFGLIERIFLAAQLGWLAATMASIVRAPAK